MKLIFRAFFKITGLFISGIIGLVLLSLLVGFIVDLATYPVLSKKGKTALNYLVSLRKEGKDNAWNYYAEAEKKVKRSKNIRDTEMPLYNYLYENAAITPELLDAIEANKDAIEAMKQGTKQAFCSIPYEYEKGMEVLPYVPYFSELRLVSNLLCIRALYELENGKNDEALDDALSVCLFGKDLASGGPGRIGTIVSAIQTDKALKVLEIGLSTRTFKQEELKRISTVLNGVEKNWPSWSWALDGEMKSISISTGKVPFYKPIEFLWEKEWGPLTVPHLVFIHLYFWRYLFSTRLATLYCQKFSDKMVLQLQERENSFRKGCFSSQKDKYIYKEEIKKNEVRNPVFSVIPRFTIPLYEAHGIDILTRMKLMNFASLVWLEYSKNNRFPATIKELGDAAIDPITGKPWEYAVSKDLAVISSPGTHFRIDSDNISLTLKKTNIKEYLSKKRKHTEK